MPEAYSTSRDQRAPTTSGARDQRTPTGVQLKHVAGTAGGYEAQSSLLTPVQRHVAPGGAGVLTPRETPARGAMGPVQRRMVQRVETPPDAQTTTPETTTTPTTDTNETPTNETPARTFEGPRTQQAYIAHLAASPYGARIVELRARGLEYQQKVAEGVIVAQTLKAEAGAAEPLRMQYETTKDDLDVEARKKLEGKVIKAEGLEANAGETMASMLDRAKKLVLDIQAKGRSAKAERDKLEGVLQAAAALSAQIDKDGFNAGRGLYVEIDETENPNLLKDARECQMPDPELAQLAVDYRNWLRMHWRDDVMADRDLAEIMYQRDLGKTGSRDGMTLDQVIAKVIIDLKGKRDPETEQAILGGDVTMATATPEELDLIYKGVLDSAMKTNAGLNGTGSVTSHTNNTNTNNTTTTGDSNTTPTNNGTPPQ